MRGVAVAGALIIGLVIEGRSVACVPPPVDPLESSPAKIKRRFDSVDSVMLVTLLKSRKLRVKEGGIDFVMDADEDTFRIDRVFKGTARPGQQFVLITSTTCGMSPHSTYDPMRMPRQWLFYRDFHEQSEFIASAWMRPLDQAYDQLPVLKKLGWKNGHAPTSSAATPTVTRDRKLIVVE